MTVHDAPAKTAQRAHNAPPARAADVLIATLAKAGVPFFFANPGTDFPPIIEAFERAEVTGATVPRPVLVTHENLAVSMAHGAYLMTGRPQATMVHVSVGTGNTITMLVNASRDRVPVIALAGRTPLTEGGNFGARSIVIHWAQEMFDQAGMLRELVKWDYELRMPDQAGDVTVRAVEIAMAQPRGPVYLALPREPLAANVAEERIPSPRPAPVVGGPAPESIEEAVALLAGARRPLIVAGAYGRNADDVGRLAALAEAFDIPVVAFGQRYMALPSSHPLHAGFLHGSPLADADLVIALESDVPWIPTQHRVAADLRVIAIGEDPIFSRYPMRSFPHDVAIAADAGATVAALHEGLKRRNVRRFADGRARAAKGRAPAAPTPSDSEPISPEFLSRKIGEVLGEDAVIFNEYPLRLHECPREKPGTFFAVSPAGGLGWGLGAALGAKLAAPEKFVVATLGDGSYVYNNPIACHWAARVHQLPVLTIIFNNGRYGAVRNATLSMFKDGIAGRQDGRFLADLDAAPAFEAIVTAHGGHGERVERPGDIAPALERARDAVAGGRQALVNVICRY